MFKVGDKVKVVGIPYYDGMYGIVSRVSGQNAYIGTICFAPSNLQKVTKFSTKGSSGSLLDMFKASFKKEPEKSFNKAGVTDAEDMLTDEGNALFINWFFKKNQDAFKKEVVDPIIEEMKNSDE